MDPSVRIDPSKKLIDFISRDVKDTDDAPDGIATLRKLKKSKREKFTNTTLMIEDLKWLNEYLKERRKIATEKVYLRELIDDSDVILPTPRETPRNPELEARVRKLTARRNAREYRTMTKSIDSVRKFLPEDSIAYQSKYT